MRSLSLMSFLLLLRRASSSSALVPPHASAAAAAAAATTTSSATTRIVPKVRAGAVRMGAMKKAARNQKAAGGPMGPKAKQSLGQNFLTDEALAPLAPRSLLLLSADACARAPRRVLSPTGRHLSIVFPRARKH